MKKAIVGFLCAATMMSAAAPALAAKAPQISAQNPAAVSTPQSEAEYTLNVSGKKLDLGTRKIFKLNDKTMVPLRLTSEALGFTVTWDGEIAEDESEVFEAVSKLPVKYREVIHLYYYEGYSTSEISSLLHKKESTVRSLLHRSREMLKKALKGAYDFDN